MAPKQQVYVSSPVLTKNDVNLSNDNFNEIEKGELVDLADPILIFEPFNYKIIGDGGSIYDFRKI